MAIALSVPRAYEEDLTAPQTTSAFNIGAGSVGIVIVHCDENTDTVGVTGVTLSDNQTPDLTFTLIAQKGAEFGTANAGYVGAWWFYTASAITGLTITATPAGDTGTGDMAMTVLEITGNVSSTDPIGASTTAVLTGDPVTTAGITPETSGIGICAFSDWNAASHTFTSSNLTARSFALTSGNLDMGNGDRTLTAGVSATANINGAASMDGNYIWFEIRDEGGGGAATPIYRSTRLTLGVGR